MGKEGVIGINFMDIMRPIPFKKNLLLFDKLIVVRETLEMARALVSLAKRVKGLDDTICIFNNQTIDFLENEGLLEIVKIDEPLNVELGNFSEEGKERIFNEIKHMVFEAEKVRKDIRLLVEKPFVEIIPDLANTFASNFPRLISIQRNIRGQEAYPLFSKEPSYENIGKKESVLKFILNRLPEPDNTISLDQLLEFRKDPNTLKKYYALVNWVNQVAKKDFNTHEIQDEYNYLYHEYTEQFKIHKIKSNQGILEIFVTATIDVLSGQLSVGGVSTSLFSLWKHNLNLLEAESNFPGKEIAYIHKTEKKFKK